jgi:hypothetical protein
MRFIAPVFVALLLLGQARGLPAPAVVVSGAPQTNAVVPPLPSSARTPVEYLRELLAMSAAEREQTLRSRSEQSRKFLEERVHYFEALTSTEREARLQTLQLRWRLLPLMKLKPAERVSALASIPEPDHSLVEQRLAQWDGLTDDLKDKVMENEHFLRFFFRSEDVPTTQEPHASVLTPDQQSQRDQEQDRWRSMSETDRTRVLREFQSLFELSTKEKARILGAMGEAERRQMERALQAYSSLPKEQRELCLRGFQKFASLSTEERQEFLENAKRWQAMSPQDRKLWRDMVNRLQIKAILPPGYRPLAPPHPSTAPASLLPLPPSSQATSTATLNGLPPRPPN